MNPDETTLYQLKRIQVSNGQTIYRPVSPVPLGNKSL